VLFPTFTFTCFFLIFLVCWWSFLTKKGSNTKSIGLIIASFIFYGWANIKFVPILLIVSLFTWTGGWLLTKTSGTLKRSIGIFVTLALTCHLILWKYTDWILDQINGFNLFHPIPLPEWVYPVGLSFFTFHAMNWFFAVWKGIIPLSSCAETTAQISFFPSLLAGPVLDKDIITGRLKESFNLKDVPIIEGIFRIAWGMTFKWVFASQAEGWADNCFEGMNTNPWDVWLGVHAYALQIFFDFAGYSSMAIGIALLMGFRLPENFTQPYLSTSFQYFWRNWHRSLSFFFRDHVYIDLLGGNKHGFKLALLSASITMVLSGIWHGANITFIIWGAWHAGLLCIERFIPKRNLWPKWLGWIVTFEGVVWGWIWFRSETLDQAISLFKQAWNISFPWKDIINVQVPLISVVWVILMFLFIFIEKLSLDYFSELSVKNTFSNYKSFCFLILISIWAYVLMILGPSGVPPFIYNGF
jgi:alginate O-acetyltransferase complex protein AlgI